MTANDDGFLPGGHEAGDVGADDGLTEHSASQNVPDSSIRTFPHLFQLELCRFNMYTCTCVYTVHVHVHAV